MIKFIKNYKHPFIRFIISFVFMLTSMKKDLISVKGFLRETY